jgi:hypothetical protein
MAGAFALRGAAARAQATAVRAAFDSAVRSIGSDVEYRRVMRSFER